MAPALLHAPDDIGAASAYRALAWTLREAGIPYLVGGTYALEYHADVVRNTKDLDLFVRRADWPRILDCLAQRGWTCELVFTHWLGKARTGDYVVDMIFASGNGMAEVDDDWLAHGVPSVVLDVPVHLVAAEEMIWSKSFVMERERFDGADVAHILKKSAPGLDWDRLVRLYGQHAAVLLAHLLLFQYIYPDDRGVVPDWVVETLLNRVRLAVPLVERMCRGTLLSREQYLTDVREWGYLDCRAAPLGRMSPQEIDEWTAAIGRDQDCTHEPD